MQSKVQRLEELLRPAIYICALLGLTMHPRKYFILVTGRLASSEEKVHYLHLLDSLTGWATMHCDLCLRSAVNLDGIMQDVELAKIASSVAY